MRRGAISGRLRLHYLKLKSPRLVGGLFALGGYFTGFNTKTALNSSGIFRSLFLVIFKMM